jgi:sortase B
MKRIVQIAALAVLCVSMYVLINDFMKEPEPVSAEITMETLPEPEPETVEEPQEEIIVRDPLVNDIDFEEYKNINSDVYAYIYIPNTAIDYPVLQHSPDNEYYLNHCIDKSSGYPGCIYSEKENSKDFSDPNTVLYGHNMKNGTMFHDLHLFEDADFFNSNRYVYIYTPEATLQYEIFAVYTATDDHLLYLCDYSDKNAFASYLAGIKNRTASNMYSKTALIYQDITLTGDDKILSLQTCTKDESKRTVLQAVLVNINYL